MSEDSTTISNESTQERLDYLNGRLARLRKERDDLLWRVRNHARSIVDDADKRSPEQYGWRIIREMGEIASMVTRCRDLGQAVSATLNEIAQVPHD